jgi:hypothetical protein
VIHVTSLFEGWNDDVVVSISVLEGPVVLAVTLYDLIPYLNPDLYLMNTSMKSWYFEKIEQLRHADLWLAITA